MHILGAAAHCRGGGGGGGGVRQLFYREYLLLNEVMVAWLCVSVSCDVLSLCSCW